MNKQYTRTRAGIPLYGFEIISSHQGSNRDVQWRRSCKRSIGK